MAEKQKKCVVRRNDVLLCVYVNKIVWQVRSAREYQQFT